jgi:hypothetical protein
VAPRFRFLRAKARAEAVDLSEGGGAGLGIELAALGEIGALPEVVEREELRRALTGRGRDEGGVEAREALAAQELRTGELQLGADAQDGRLAGGADPEMALLHEKIGPVFLTAYGVVALRGPEGEGAHMELWRFAPLELHDEAFGLQRRLEGEGAERVEEPRLQRRALTDELGRARAVPQAEKDELAPILARKKPAPQ